MSTALGRQAEGVAADFLRQRGFVVHAQNWRTRWCEIDIVARKAGCVYFVEVKYRGSTNWGTGLDYITVQKLRQMHFAAEFWQAAHKTNADYFLAALELTGNPPTVTAWLDDI